MRMKSLSLCILLGLGSPLAAQVSIGIGLPGINLGINLGAYPDLSPIPGYPVYYAPQTDANLFFYDGLYWLYSQDGWYSSAWYNGPWDALDVEAVPLFLLRVPVRYYRQAPTYFRAWRDDAPPRWGERWGHDWEQHHRDWDHWDRDTAPRAAPLPLYQRDYGGDRYPRGEQQRDLRSRHYDYQPREEIVRQVYQRPAPTPRRPEGHDDRASDVRPPVMQEHAAAPPHANDERQSRSREQEHKAVAPREAPQDQAHDKPLAEQPRREIPAAALTQRPPPETSHRVPTAPREDRARDPVATQQRRPVVPERAVTTERPAQAQAQPGHPQQAAPAPQAAPQPSKKRGHDKQDDQNTDHEDHDRH